MQPATADSVTLLAIIEHDSDGLVVFDDGDGRVLYANPAAHQLLDCPAGSAVGRTASQLGLIDEADDAGSLRTGILRVGGKELSLHLSVLSEDRADVFLRVRDVTEAKRQEQRLQTFSRTSASIAFAEELATGLDRLARDVHQATGMHACTFFLMETDGDLRRVGASGPYARIPDYVERLRKCEELGAPLLSAAAFETRKPQIVSDWRMSTLADPRFAPLHSLNAAAEWDNIAVIPLVIRGEPVGVFNGFYAREHLPSEEDLSFLLAIADQAAVAIDNTRMLAELEKKAALDERHHLARELHDSVSQALFSMTLQSRALEILASEDWPDPATIRRGACELNALTRGALAEMRALIFQLRPNALHEEGLAAAIERHAAAVSTREDIQIVVEVVPDRALLSREAEQELFRVAGEAIANAVRHASATRIDVRLEQDDTTFRLLVADDGTGFDPSAEHEGHLGLISMKERVARIGGTFYIDSAPERSTSISASVTTTPRPAMPSEGGNE